MCTFTFLYTDGSTVKCEHIKSASCPSSSKTTVSEKELTAHTFNPGKDLWLFTENGSFCVCHDGLRCIEVVEE